MKRKDKYCPGLQPCAAGKLSKDSQTRSYFHSKQRRGASRVQTGKGLTVKGLRKMPWDALLAQIPLYSTHLQTGGSLRPLASDPYPPPGSPFPQKGEGRGWQQADGGKEGWSVLRASPWKKLPGQPSGRSREALELSQAQVAELSSIRLDLAASFSQQSQPGEAAWSSFSPSSALYFHRQEGVNSPPHFRSPPRTDFTLCPGQPKRGRKWRTAE